MSLNFYKPIFYMKKFTILSLSLLILFSCSKEQVKPTRELNVTVKSVSVTSSVIQTDRNVYFYPNPFKDMVHVTMQGADSAQLVISNGNGDTKKIKMHYSEMSLKFSNEKAGVYYCEVLVNNKLFRSYLIKL